MNHLFLALLVVPILLTTSAGASSYNETFDEDFSDAQEVFLYTAIQKAYTGLFADRRVYDCIYRVARTESLDPVKVSEIHGDAWLRTGKMFQYQWGVFSAFVRSNANLPNIHIKYAYDDTTFAGGWANYGKVHTSVDKDTGNYRWHGTFEVAINTAKIGGPQSYENWAGLIAHEMLHNLMHAHPSAADVGQAAAYSSDFLINAAQSCVATYGRTYANPPVHRCGGRIKY